MRATFRGQLLAVFRAMTLADALLAASGGAMLVGTGVLAAAVLRIQGTAAFLAAALVAMAATIVAVDGM